MTSISPYFKELYEYLDQHGHAVLRAEGCPMLYVLLNARGACYYFPATYTDAEAVAEARERHARYVEMLAKHQAGQADVSDGGDID